MWAPLLLASLSVALLQVPGDQKSVDELWSVYQQNRKSFVTLRVMTEWTLEIPQEQRDSTRREIEFLNRKMASNRSKLTEKDSAQIQDHLKQLKTVASGKNSGFAKTRLWYTVGPDGMEIQDEIPNFDVRSKDAKSRNLASFTGGDFKIYRLAGDGKWRCFDPYPFVGKIDPVGYGQSEISLNGMLPPMVPHKHIRVQLDPMDVFWGPRVQVRSLGRRPGKDGRSYAILGRAGNVDPGEMWVAAIDPSKHGLASWIARWVVLGDGKNGGSKLRDDILAGSRTDLVRVIIDQIETLRGQWSIGRRDDLIPVMATYWDEAGEVTDAGWYPRLITHCMFGPVRPMGLKGDEEYGTLPIGHLEDGKLVVKSVEANFDFPNDAFAAEFTKGTNYLDLDTKKGGVIGVSLEDRIRNIIPVSPSMSRSRLVIIASNIILLIVVVATILVRKKI
ncbi:hypothetical protein ACYOEI_03080 [Singulisphaera rosea]